MLQCILSSVERGATRGPLFEFTPEFYMDTAINAFHGLRHYFHPTTNFNDIPGKLLLECYLPVIVVFTVSSLCFISYNYLNEGNNYNTYHNYYNVLKCDWFINLCIFVFKIYLQSYNRTMESDSLL